MQVSAPTKRTTPTRDDFHITPRVLAMLAAVARYGILTSDQIARLDGGSRQKVTRILQRLVELGLLRRVDREPDPLLAVSFFDARPRTFAATPKTLRVLSLAGMSLNVAPKKSEKLLAHDVETAEFFFLMSAAVASHGAVRLIDQPELMTTFPRSTRAMKKPLRLAVTVEPRDFPQLGKLLAKPTPIGIEPDRLFALASRADNLGTSFAYEHDRGTEDIDARQIKGRATWTRKALGYTAIWLQGRHIAQFGEVCRSFRVLTLTTSETRIRNMIEVAQFVGAPAGLFFFTTPQLLAAHGALGPTWISAKHDGISLVERA